MILDTLKSDLYEAQKAKQALKVSVVRYLLADIKNKEIELRPLHQEVTDEIIVKLLRKQVKKRSEVIEEFAKAGRQDLVDKETAELEIVKDYLSRFDNETQ
ncbi:MAG TPA: GatB/YqeY domain-containing protein [Patescibacteria group bacterium]|nr:GatB/YqeY domain-containing protein [Patescibacteria group bacterium]